MNILFDFFVIENIFYSIFFYAMEMLIVLNITGYIHYLKNY